MSEPCRRARDKLLDLLFEDGATPFFPLDCLRGYFNFQKVKEIMSCSCAQCQEDLTFFSTKTDPETYVNDIMGGTHDPSDLTKTYYGVFGLLVFVEHPLFIIGFLDRNISDYMLESWVTNASLFSRDNLGDFMGEYRRDAVRFERFAKKFDMELPKFAIPHLESARFSQFDTKVTLPFVQEEEIGLKVDEDGHRTSEGANGRVFAFKIHREYCKFPGIGSRAEFARKRIETPQPLAFLERSNIQYVQRFKDDHIVKLVKAYGHGETINLIFPKAWTNLDHLLRDPAFRYTEKRGARLELADAWKQLLGIATALKKIQGFDDGADSRGGGNTSDHLCIHFDLKPDNILVERENGNWIITDFGQAALTRRRRGTTPRVGGHFGTDAYAPPEIEDINMEFGRAYDIWSLGCIILEVTTFIILGYAGLNGTDDFNGLDRARRALPPGAKNANERFFYQESPNGVYVVKKEISDFMTSLEKRHARSQDSSEESRVFLKKILDLINGMLRPNVQDRVDISRVVDILSSAVRRASAGTFKPKAHKVCVSPGETVLGGTKLNEIELWHRSVAHSQWEVSYLEIFENEAGFMRLHCWSHGHEPVNVSFRRNDVKILPLYAFWNPKITHDSRAWIDLSFLSPNRRSEVSDAMFSFDGNSGLEHARLVQSKLTSQDIVESFALRNLKMSRPVSVGKTIKGMWRKVTRSDRRRQAEGEPKCLEFGSATVQIWVEQEDSVAEMLTRRESCMSQETTRRTVRYFDKDQHKVPPCRVAIYLHQQQFVCTIRVDLNWVLEEHSSDDKLLSFKPYPPGRNVPFYASWIRPTQEEFDNGCPAGIPLSPKVLQYFEDLDIFEADDFELKFLSTDDRENFKWKFWEIKKTWHLASQKAESSVPVNRMPEGMPRPPEGVGTPPVPKRRAQLLPLLSGQMETGSEGSRHDSTMETPEEKPQHIVLLPVP